MLWPYSKTFNDSHLPPFRKTLCVLLLNKHLCILLKSTRASIVCNWEIVSNIGRLLRSHHSIVTGAQTGERTCTSSDLVCEKEVQLQYLLLFIFSSFLLTLNFRVGKVEFIRLQNTFDCIQTNFCCLNSFQHISASPLVSLISVWEPEMMRGSPLHVINAYFKEFQC